MSVAHPLSPLLLSQAMQVEQQLAPFSEAERPALALSEFMVESFKLYPQWWQHLHDCPPQPDEYKTYSLKLAQQLLGVEDETGLMRVLRLYRRHMLARIAWMQALSLASTEETLSQLSELAETIIVAAREYLYRYCCAQWGTPCNAQGEPQPLLILGMGKLGGRELNFSSDIDLIFVYPENGMTQGGGREIENIQFFTRLGQRLIKVLDQPTIEGFVYRVDMRLRPFGDSGPLILSFAALEDYYQEQGRDWERYAMVKARLMGEDAGRYGQELHNILRPFIFRRYIDFSVIQSLRNMKAMIAREVRRRVLHDNIKLGAGGIREIEFITQVFQLIRGGRERSLQLHSLLPSLQAISVLGLLTSEQVQLLIDSYLFLRRLENLLQAINDEQTQTLPKDELNQNRLAWGMGCADWIVLRHHLEQHMQGVRTIFNQLIGDEEQEEAVASKASFSALWQDDLAEQDLDRFTPHLEVEARQRLLHCINDFHRDVDKRTIGNRGRDVLEQLMPILLAEVCAQKEAVRVLQCLTPLLLNIVTRTTYLELLQEYPAALTQLIRLCAASPMIASQLARHPLLLDELLDPNTLYRPMPQERYRDELRQYLMRIPEGDEEQHLEALRQFKHTQQLRIAAGDIAGVLPVMKVSDHLTYLAEAMIEAVVVQAWGQMVARYGQPAHLQARDGRGFAVLGYGKMGGWELGYSSDLDLVFLLDCPADVMTDGVRSIDGRQFYLRLAQRVMHLFSTRTASGILYEVDARLRPSGASGMLVSTLEAFVDYQREEAWTWEHQALVRARPVYGDAKIHQQFAALRHEILCQFRDEEALKTEIREMREKMRHHQGEKQHDLFNIKADIGGITDIEFIAQYLVLRYASREPRLTRWSDNVRIFELMANYHIMSNHEANTLTHAYVTMRDNIHHLALQERSANVDPALFAKERKQVIASWHHWLSENSGSYPLV